MIEIPQWLVNTILAGGSALGGWWTKTIWEGVQKLTADLKALELHIATHYVPHARFDETIRALFVKLDRIEDKIDHKADKP